MYTYKPAPKNIQMKYLDDLIVSSYCSENLVDVINFLYFIRVYDVQNIKTKSKAENSLYIDIYSLCRTLYKRKPYIGILCV